MLIIGFDFHTPCQQIAMLDEAAGELVARPLEHEKEKLRPFIAVCSCAASRIRSRVCAVRVTCGLGGLFCNRGCGLRVEPAGKSLPNECDFQSEGCSRNCKEPEI